MKYKLLSVERYFNTYKNSGDIPISEILLDIPLETLLSIITPKEGDINLYDSYELSEQQATKINDLLEIEIELDFENYFYVYEPVGIYEF